MSFRDYGESKNIKIPEEQEKIMDIMCEAWEQCLNRCDCVDNCPDRAGQNMRLAMCMALKQSRLLAEAGYAPVVRCADCKYYQDNNGGYPHEMCRWRNDETPDADDYCSQGERKK
jgi:hypothetical protein